MGRECLYGRTDNVWAANKASLGGDKSEGGKLLYNAPLCVLMGSLYIHLNDSGYLFNAMPTPKKNNNNKKGSIMAMFVG